jgi:IMP and pyridine-specific 5'-nucleotidase
MSLHARYEEYNAKYSIASRKFVRPSFNEIRHILNLAQLTAIAKQLKLITLDGDCTLYADGKAFEDIVSTPSIAHNFTWLLGALLNIAPVS